MEDTTMSTEEISNLHVVPTTSSTAAAAKLQAFLMAAKTDAKAVAPESGMSVGTFARVPTLVA
jgi:hypothetical protein